jgi:hypothetical protein
LKKEWSGMEPKTKYNYRIKIGLKKKKS